MAKKAENPKRPKKKAAKINPEKRSGRSKYEQLKISQKLKSIEGWARHGSTLKEIAEMLGVSEATLYRWKLEHPEFCEAIRVGAREANGEILNSAFRQSVGFKELVSEVIKCKKIAYEHEGDGALKTNEDGSPKMVLDSKGNPVLEDSPLIVEYNKYFPPDPRMTMFMMANRLKDDYQIKILPESGSIIVQHMIPDGETNAENNQH